MRTINIQEAKTQLSRLVEEASRGESFIIAKAGKPMVKVTAFAESEHKKPRRLGFLKGKISVPADFDSMGAREIEKSFAGEE
jgi:prevent-host-death family protein